MDSNLSKLFFGKELRDISIDDVESFFSEPREESDRIEFKSYYSKEENKHKEKENGVLKSICAFLNSDGGILLWGAPVGKKVSGRKEKIFEGELSPCDILIEKDSFINRCADLITPSPYGIRFQPIEKGDDYVYIIEVPKSQHSPHQFKYIYYMRLDGQSRPAPHHYIEALFRKVSFPKLEGYIKFTEFGQSLDFIGKFYLKLNIYIVNQSKYQNEDNLYLRLITTIGQFRGHISNDLQDTLDQTRSYELDGHELRMDIAKPTLYNSELYSPTETIIIDPSALEANNYLVEVLLYFGGKKSPLVISEYKIQLENADSNNLNESIISLSENKYAFERSEDHASDHQQIRELLGR